MTPRSKKDVKLTSNSKKNSKNRCEYIFMQGPSKGNRCISNCREKLCYKHNKNRNSNCKRCKYVFTQGPNKGNRCISKCREELCHKHNQTNKDFQKKYYDEKIRKSPETKLEEQLLKISKITNIEKIPKRFTLDSVLAKVQTDAREIINIVNGIKLYQKEISCKDIIIKNSQYYIDKSKYYLDEGFIDEKDFEEINEKDCNQWSDKIIHDLDEIHSMYKKFYPKTIRRTIKHTKKLDDDDDDELVDFEDKYCIEDKEKTDKRAQKKMEKYMSKKSKVIEKLCMRRQINEAYAKRRKELEEQGHQYKEERYKAYEDSDSESSEECQ
jgi:hypothetical protein